MLLSKIPGKPHNVSPITATSAGLSHCARFQLRTLLPFYQLLFATITIDFTTTLYLKITYGSVECHARCGDVITRRRGC